MSWQTDIQIAKYTSPSGLEFEFMWEALSVDVDKKTTEFQFAEIDGVFIQDLGRAGRSYPFTFSKSKAGPPESQVLRMYAAISYFTSTGFVTRSSSPLSSRT